MIVKHRRGTTKEWQEVDLIPEEGELVIEECLDGSWKCKIGTGYTKFSKLPYIDEQTRITLLQEIASTKAELEDISFRTLYSDEYQEIKRQIDEKKSEREAYIKARIDEINEALKKEKIEATVYGRPKHFYSIYKKMKQNLHQNLLQNLLTA